MNIKDLLSMELESNVSVFNEPFSYLGKAEIHLKDGTKMFWLYNDSEGMLSVSPEEEELVLFEKLEDEIEPSETILYSGNEYEFSYEGSGNVEASEGNSPTEEEDKYIFSDYESTAGETLRFISSENTGEAWIYHGRTVSEDDLSEI
jgi:hypothetical protein